MAKIAPLQAVVEVRITSETHEIEWLKQMWDQCARDRHHDVVELEAERDRLRRWADEARPYIAQLERVREAAKEWEAMERLTMPSKIDREQLRKSLYDALAAVSK